jgi:hypothetical protein
VRLPKPQPLDISLALFFASSGLAVAGVYLLAGTGWALVSAAVFLMALSVLIARGAARG